MAFASLGLTLGSSLAHLFQMPGKLHLSREQYLSAQQIYRKWNHMGIPPILALASTAGIAFAYRRRSQTLRWALIASAGIAAGQAIYWIFTYPANTQTNNWTRMPPNWDLLRQRWEYSHAVVTLLYVAGLATLARSRRYSRMERPTETPAAASAAAR